MSALEQFLIVGVLLLGCCIGIAIAVIVIPITVLALVLATIYEGWKAL